MRCGNAGRIARRLFLGRCGSIVAVRLPGYDNLVPSLTAPVTGSAARPPAPPRRSPPDRVTSTARNAVLLQSAALVGRISLDPAEYGRVVHLHAAVQQHEH